MADIPLAERLRMLERRIQREEQTLLTAIDQRKRQLREMMAGRVRSYELEDVRRELRKMAEELDH